MQDTEYLYQAAEAYRKEGLNAIPSTSEKRPVGKWAAYQNSMLPHSELTSRLNEGAYGLGILCGAGSGSLEVIDLDTKYDLNKNDEQRNIAFRFMQLISDHDQTLLDKLRINESPTHGLHFYYRCAKIDGNQKLARRNATPEELAINPDEKVKVLLETRGLGGFIVAPPTKGYTVWQENPIPIITEDERAFLLDAARSFNEVVEVVQPKPQREFDTDKSPYELTPWDDYNDRGDTIDLLEKHGWTVDHKYSDAERIYLIRPGKDKGYSADYHKEKKLFKCWSTSQDDFQPERAYGPVAVYTQIEHRGNYSEATKKLEEMGYGKRKPKPATDAAKLRNQFGVGNPDGRPEPAPKTLADFDYLLVTKEKEITKEEPTITICDASFAAPHNISMISAAPKGAKTAINNVMVSCSISEDGTADGFPDIKAKVNTECKAVLLFDTEQSEADQQYNVNTIVRRAGLEETPDFLRCYNIRQLDFRAYKEVTEAICKLCAERFGGIHSIYIDGGADYIASVNDEEQSTEIIQWFTHLAIHFDCPVIIVVHQNPGGEKERGHFGSTGQRKCYGLMSIVKEGEVFTLQPKMMRRAGNGDVSLIQFSYNIVKGYHIQVDAPDKELLVAVKTREKVRETAAKVFPTATSYCHRDAINRIMDVTHKKLTAAKDLLKNMCGWEYVIKREDGNYMLNPDKVGKVVEGRFDPSDPLGREGRIGSERTVVTQGRLGRPPI